MTSFYVRAVLVEIVLFSNSIFQAETARLSSFVGAIAIGDLVKSTLGPRGKQAFFEFVVNHFRNGQNSVRAKRQVR